MSREGLDSIHNTNQPSLGSRAATPRSSSPSGDSDRERAERTVKALPGSRALHFPEGWQAWSQFFLAPRGGRRCLQNFLISFYPQTPPQGVKFTPALQGPVPGITSPSQARPHPRPQSGATPSLACATCTAVRCGQDAGP